MRRLYPYLQRHSAPADVFPGSPDYPFSAQLELALTRWWHLL
jgi:hypothetical protein